MMISTKGRYALRFMVDLAEHNTGEYIALKDCAERLDISRKYLENIVAALSRARLIEGRNGKGGGYRLNRPPESYTVGSVLKLTEGSLAPVACLACQPNDCPRAAVCKTLPMWQRLDSMIDDFFEGITIDQLAAAPQAGDYVI